MTPRADTLETVALALELLRRIPRGYKVSTQELHRQLREAGLERDVRTIQRQLEMLSQRFEIERDDREKPYGYRWREQARPLAIPNLSPKESLLLQLAQEHLKTLLPAHVMTSMEGFFTQARRNLGPTTQAHLERQWRDKVRVVATSQPLLPPTIQPGVFEAVSDALYANRWLVLDYRNANGKNSTVDVMPLGLAQQGPRLYLVCRYRDYDNERSLALHRIHKAHISTLGFDRPPGFNLKRFDDDGRFGFGEGQRIRLRFRIDQDAGLHLLESPLSKDQLAQPCGNGQLDISATLVDSAMLQWWLRGFGDAVSDIRKTPVPEDAPLPEDAPPPV